MVLFVLAISFSNCTNNSQQNNTSEISNQQKKNKQVEIKFVGQWLGQGDRERLVREFVKEYNFLNQDIKVILKFPEEIFNDQRGQKVLAKWNEKQMKAEKSEYDIIMINNDVETIIDDPEWAKKYLVDFSEIEEFRNNTIDGLLTDSLKNVWHGIIPGPLIEGFYYALWCNNTIAKKLGLEVKQMGMTLTDFQVYLKAVYEYNQKNKGDYIIPVFEAGDWKTLRHLFNQLYISELNDRNEYFTKYASERKLQAWHKTLKAVEALSVYEPLCPGWDTMGWQNNFHIMLENKCLFFSNGSWMYSFWQNLNNDNLANIMPTQYPVFKPVDSYVGGYQIIWAVPKNAPHKEEAIKFLLALNSAKTAEKWIRYTKCPTGIKGKLATVSIGVDKFEDFTYQIGKQYGHNGLFYVKRNYYLFGENYKYSDFSYEVLQKQITADNAIAEIRKLLKEQKIPIVQ
jgi:ABC-type glycerol-3-phosphate transport system substrate-binding protein